MNLKMTLIGCFASVLLPITALSQTLIKAGKTVTITVSGVPVEEKSRLDGSYPVSDSGMINMAHIGTVRAAGLKADELSRVLQSTYKSRQIYTNPTFQVLTSTGDTLDEQLVHIGGKVGRPGPTKFTQGLTLYQAIQAAGGPTEFGSMYRVKLYRDGKQRLYDLTKEESMSVPLKPGDTIEVPQKNIWNR